MSVIGVRYAVFIDSAYRDIDRCRVWVKTRSYDALVMVTDDITEAKSAFLRELRCSDIQHAVFRITGTLNSVAYIEEARWRRDRAMAELADEVVDFGVFGGSRFGGRTTYIEDRHDKVC